MNNHWMLRWFWRDHGVSSDVHDMVERLFNGPAKKEQAGTPSAR